MVDAIAREVPISKQALLESSNQLADVADYCEKRYLEATSEHEQVQVLSVFRLAIIMILYEVWNYVVLVSVHRPLSSECTSCMCSPRVDATLIQFSYYRLRFSTRTRASHTNGTTPRRTTFRPR